MSVRVNREPLQQEPTAETPPAQTLGSWDAGGGRTVSLLKESDGLFFTLDGRKTQISSSLYDLPYAVNLSHLFHRTIGINLQRDPPHSSCFLPQLCKAIPEMAGVQVALFGHKEPDGTLRGLRWGVVSPGNHEDQPIEVTDPVTRDFILRAPFGGTRDEMESYTRKFQVIPHQAPDSRIVAMALKYQRSWYETAGKTCTQVLIDYLSDPTQTAPLETLVQLGLSPEQLRIHHTPEDFSYFQDLERTLQRLPAAQAAMIFANLERLYPTLFEPLLEELRREIPPAEGTSEYATILAGLQRGVIGQQLATEYAAAALNSQNNSDANKVFLFVGPTGVGKTELAKVVSTFKRNRYVEFNMERYRSPESFNTLFGSSAGYVGSTDKPHFSKQIDKYAETIDYTNRDTPECTVKDVVILFDELEKAHSNLKQSFLTLFREGHCTIAYSSDRKNISLKYRFKRCIFVGTSNLYKDAIVRGFQTGASRNTIAENFIRLNTSHPLPESYSPELLNRMQVVAFGPIPRGEPYKTVLRNKIPSLFAEMKTALQCDKIEIEPDRLDQVLQVLENTLYGDGVGMQTIKTYFEVAITNAIYRQATWNPLQDKKLILTTDENQERLAIKCVRTRHGRILEDCGTALVT